jgi:hypothetical protein
MDRVAIRVFSFSISPMVIAASHQGLVSVPHAPCRLGCEKTTALTRWLGMIMSRQM